MLVLDAEPIDDMPILDLRLRKGVRRHGMQALQAQRATDLLSSERAGAAAPVRCAQAGEEIVDAAGASA